MHESSRTRGGEGVIFSADERIESLRDRFHEASRTAHHVAIESAASALLSALLRSGPWGRREAEDVIRRLEALPASLVVAEASTDA